MIGTARTAHFLAGMVAGVVALWLWQRMREGGPR